MRILFLNPPFLKSFSRESRSPAVTKSGTLYYPAWLAYAAGFAERADHQVLLIDAVADKLSVTELDDKVSAFAPDVIVGGTSTPSLAADASAVGHLKELLSGKPFAVLVGTHVSAEPQGVLTSFPQIDAVARREYDATIAELGHVLAARGDLSTVQGLSWRRDSQIVHNADRPYLSDLDQLPFASEIYKRFLKIENYFYAHVRYPMVSIFTSRGCNAKCDYCVYPQTMFGGFRARSPENIAAEFKWIRANLPHVREVLIDDDTFTMDQDHAIAVSKELIKTGNRLPWTCEVRANLERETMEWMKKARCRLLVVGFESVDQQVLNNVRKGTKMAIVNRFVADAEKVGLKMHGCFMAGNPGDTPETLEATLNWAIQHNFDTVQFFPLIVYPGTRSYQWATENNLIRARDFREWVTPSGMHNSVLDSPTMTSQQLLDFCDDARRRYYLRPRYIVYKALQAIADPREGIKTVKAFRTFYKRLFRRTSAERSAA